MLVLLYIPNGPKNITIASIFTTNTALGGIIYFYINFLFYYNCNSKYII